MEKIIRIDGFNNKPTKDGSGTFPCFECLIDGKTSSIGVFESDVVGELKKHIDQWVKVVMTKRPNSGFWNITHFVALATKEEIPNLTEEAKSSDAVPMMNRAQSPTEAESQGALEAPAPIGLQVKVPSEIITRVMHELVDNRIVYNKYEFGKAEDRHTIKYIKGDSQDFEDQYRYIIRRRQIVDAELNPKQ